MTVRHDWTLDEARALHDLPLLELVPRAQAVHAANQPKNAVQLCTLLSVKTGGCPEDCSYCPQSARYKTSVGVEKLLSVDDVVASARRARESGASRFCIGAAWRSPRRAEEFDRVCDMVRGIKGLGMEACATLGMLTEEQAAKLKDAGLSAYNHNLDTSREHYPKIISTRTYDDRLETLGRVAAAGIGVCSGGIIGMGESIDDRCRMLVELASLRPHPTSVPINALVPVEGTPLATESRIEPFELVRMIATARIMFPRSMVRLSAGRSELSREAQMLCFLAGANSVFYGEKLLTTGNPDTAEDEALFRDAGLVPLTPELEAAAPARSPSLPTSSAPARTADQADRLEA